jgi:hypothetical protein
MMTSFMVMGSVLWMEGAAWAEGLVGLSRQLMDYQVH